MKIVFEHSEVVPPNGYGGTERILFWLMRELAQRGHHVSLIGHPKSRVSEFGIHLIPRLRSGPGSDWRALVPRDADIVHLFHTPSVPLEFPVLVTIHGNGKPGEAFHPNTVFLSQNHAARHGSSKFVYNGIRLEDYPFPGSDRRQWDHFLFLAKAKWKVKNLSDCVKACRKQRRHLHVAGGRAWTFSHWIHSHGMVGNQAKLALLRHAGALLFPVRWHEPFGIAIIEAFAMGVPVVGSRYGSLPELIHPDTGILCDNYPSFEEAVREAAFFDGRRIREWVEHQFPISRTANEYLKLYADAAQGVPINPQPPRTISADSPEELLPF